MAKKDLISIIAPVFNERDNIAWTVMEIYKTVKPRFELLIIYDFDEDNTIPVAVKLQKKYKQSLPANAGKNIRIIKNTKGRGVMRAIKTGFEKAQGNILIMMAVDRTDDPNAINVMYQKILEGHDLICPTRYSKGGTTNAPISVKSLLSRTAGISTPLILGIPTSDLTYSYKMFRKNLLKKIKIESEDGFEFAEELTIKAHFAGYKIVEVPCKWVDRTKGTSKFKLYKWLPIYIKWYLYGIGKRMRLI